MSGPFEEAAVSYRDVGMGPLALPSNAKYPPVEGYTGKVHRGVYATADEDIQFQAEQHPNGNIGVRLPEDIIGIDVDARHGGDTMLALLEADLGVLPPTLHSTSRADGSRIAYYRVPTGEVWKEIGDGIDTIYWGYRYGVCWPSIHPDTGKTYYWYYADGTEYPGVPEGGWDSAVDLPGAWVERFQGEDVPERGDFTLLRPEEARRRAQGVLRWLGAAKDGERNSRIYATALVLGGLWSRVPDDCDEDDLTEEALTDAAQKVFADISVEPDEWKANDTFRRGWEAGVRNPAADVEWRVTAEEDFGKRKKVSLDVTNDDDAYKAMCLALGTRSLSGIFRRDNNLVHTPRIDEDGYVSLTDGKREYEDGTVRYDEDGPAQVRRLDIPALRAYAAHHAQVFRLVVPRGGHHPERRAALLPAEIAGLLVGAPEYVTGARPLKAVVHTPLVLADCTVLSRPGYDEPTGILYLPELDVPVPDGDVTREQVDAAVALIDLMLGPPGCSPDQGFPFETLDDRATYIAAFLTPVLAQIVGPPYPLIAIGAPSPGSGKSYLAWILREVHGGVFRAEMPRSDEELRKQISSILDQTTGRVVTFDNLSGTFTSSRFDGLLTSAVWTDRLLGSTTEMALTNDRLWGVTGNNLRFGGDMRRRVRWVTIDAHMVNPEARVGFKINLKPWVREHRGDLLGALLTLIVGWCQAGQPVPVADRSDDFTRWTQVTQGILDWAGIDGVVGGSVRDGGLEESEDADVLDVIHAAMAEHGLTRWTAGDVLRASDFDDSLADVLPRPAHGGRRNEKSLGLWLSRWQNRPTEAGLTLRKQGKRWWIDWDIL